MCSAHFWKRIFEKMYFDKMTCVILFGDQSLIFGRSPQVVKTKKTRSAAVIGFQVVMRRDGCSKVHSQRISYSIFSYKNLYSGSIPELIELDSISSVELNSIVNELNCK